MGAELKEGELPMMARPSDNRRCKHVSHNTRVVLKSSDSETRERKSCRYKRVTYGKLHEEHRLRRNRPCTYRNWTAVSHGLWLYRQKGLVSIPIINNELQFERPNVSKQYTILPLPMLLLSCERGGWGGLDIQQQLRLQLEEMSVYYTQITG